ncbi:ABC transporter substrate-binding protein [Halorhodospira halochloris]|nr:ABC transporter substrate-binding protein [Halorhodospira halochloris]
MPMISKSLRTRVGLLVVLALFTLAFVWSAAADAKQHPREIVDEVSSKVVALLDEYGDELKDDPVRTYEKFAPIIEPHVDFERIGARMLGPHWRDADAETRESFINEFKRSLVRTYASSMEEYKDLDFRILGSRQRDAGIQVGVEVEGGSRVLFRFIDSSDAWKLEDVTFEGVSVVQNYREDFRSRLRDKDLPEVVEDMRARNQEIGF